MHNIQNPLSGLTETIQTLPIGNGLSHVASWLAYAEVLECIGHREISDATAVTIASWFAGYDTHGIVFAQLSATGSAVVDDLLDAIHAEYIIPGTALCDCDALDMLATWALNHPSRQDVSA